MVDDRRRAARHIRGNVTSGGRYDSAEHKMHLEPEVAPLGIDDAEVRVPEALPGALPENAGDHKAEAQTPPREGVVRLPEATAEALRDEE